MRSDSIANPVSVALRGARVTYDGVVLFDALDFALPGGTWTSLLGPSGVGKSTLLRLAAGLVQEPHRGEVACGDGRPLAGRFAYMAQQDLLLPWASALDNVLIGARLRGRRDRAAIDRAAALLDEVGLGGRGRALPRELSGGQRQRVALARTLFEDRPVVLMDEPFSALDALTRLRLQDLAARLLAGRTVLFVTHDPVEALRLADRIFVMTGQPATLEQVAPPPGPIPRAPGDPELARRHGALIDRLGGNGTAA